MLLEGHSRTQCCTCILFSKGENRSPRPPTEQDEVSALLSDLDPLMLGESSALCQMCRLPQRAKGVVSLVLDLKFALSIPFNYRCALDGLDHQKSLLDQEEPVSQLGLKAIKMSGSGQPTPEGFKWLLSRLGVEPAQLLVIDLRQEGHGFANNKPVTWHATFNWANVGKDYAWIIDDEQRRLEEFSSMKQVEFFEEVKTPANPDGVTMPHRTVPSIVGCMGLSERALVEGLGAHYTRLTVPDHAGPADEQVDVFVKMVRIFSSTRHVHMHCRAGRGRTTMFMCLMDMMFNARDVACMDIIRRQGLLPKDKYDLMKIPKNWKGRPMEERARFLLLFYEYAQQYPMGSTNAPSWSKWRAEMNAKTSSSSAPSSPTTSSPTTTSITKTADLISSFHFPGIERGASSSNYSDDMGAREVSPIVVGEGEKEER